MYTRGWCTKWMGTYEINTLSGADEPSKGPSEALHILDASFN